MDRSALAGRFIPYLKPQGWGQHVQSQVTSAAVLVRPIWESQNKVFEKVKGGESVGTAAYVAQKFVAGVNCSF